MKRSVFCGKVMEYNYVCNIWHHWSPLMTHSIWW